MDFFDFIKLNSSNRMIKHQAEAEEASPASAVLFFQAAAIRYLQSHIPLALCRAFWR